MMRIAVHALLLGSLTLAAPTWAQCPDGSPPPCPVRRTSPAAPSVAVLTFGLLSRDSGDAYLGEGLADAISTRLGQVRRLSVTSRTSVRRLRGADAMPPAALGRALGAGYLVSGTLLRTGQRIRVTIELVRAPTGMQVWSGQFDRPAGDILAIEAEAAAALAARVTGRLSPAERTALGARPTASPEAYDLYLRGRYWFNRQTKESLAQSLKYFRAALARDSDFALAQVAIADTYFWLVDDWLSPREAYPRMRDAVERALAIDSGLARAHTLRGTILLWFDWDRPAAEQALRHAIALDSADAIARQYYAYFLSGDAALAEMRRAHQLDPLNTTIQGDLVGLLAGTSRFDEAIALAQRTLSLDSTQFAAWLGLGETYVATGRTEEAIVAYERARELRWARASLGLVHAYAAAHSPEEARRVLAEMEARAEREYVSPIILAWACAAVGDTERTFTWLDRAVDERSGWLFGFEHDPAFAALRSDPRFARILERIGSLRR